MNFPEPYPRIRGKDFTDREIAIIKEVGGYTLSMPESIVQLVRAVDYIVDARIPGDFVECGVYKGGSVVAMIRALEEWTHTYERRIWLYDTFDGMPRPDAMDIEFGIGPAHTIWAAQGGHETGSDWVRATLAEVRSRITSLGYPEDRIKFVAGMVENTIPSNIPDQIALLRLDTDFYRSTKHELIHLFPRLVRGGILIIDDYFYMAQCKQAVDEYFQDHPIFLGRCDEHVRVGVKL